MEEKRDQAHTN